MPCSCHVGWPCPCHTIVETHPKEMGTGQPSYSARSVVAVENGRKGSMEKQKNKPTRRRGDLKRRMSNGKTAGSGNSLFVTFFLAGQKSLPVLHAELAMPSFHRQPTEAVATFTGEVQCTGECLKPWLSRTHDSLARKDFSSTSNAECAPSSSPHVMSLAACSANEKMFVGCPSSKPQDRPTHSRALSLSSMMR